LTSTMHGVGLLHNGFKCSFSRQWICSNDISEWWRYGTHEDASSHCSAENAGRKVESVSQGESI